MLISVNSFEEAKSYPVLFNSSEIMLDNNRDVFYVKSVDAMGKYTISSYKFEKIENEKPITAENFVTREQFESLNAKLDVLLNQFTAPQEQVAQVAQDTQQSKGRKILNG